MEMLYRSTIITDMCTLKKASDVAPGRSGASDCGIIDFAVVEVPILPLSQMSHLATIIDMDIQP